MCVREIKCRERSEEEHGTLLHSNSEFQPARPAITGITAIACNSFESRDSMEGMMEFPWESAITHPGIRNLGSSSGPDATAPTAIFLRSGAPSGNNPGFKPSEN